MKKRQIYSEPIRISDWKISFLKDAAKLLSDWRETKRPGLTSATFTACITTLNALAEISEHLMEKHEFSYVMLGKLQSDPIEGRFGQYRQINGASYFISIRQILHAEKKLRILNLMQQKLLYLRL